MRLHLRMKKFLKEIKNNPGLLPKVLVIIFRFGNFAYYKVKLPIIRQFLIIIYRLFDLLFVKLLLNDDISGRTKIGWGFKIYHPYGIFVNEDAEIGENFVCRGQVTIGNKGDKSANNGSPKIGNNVDVGVGAKIIGPIKIDDGCVIGTNAVVVKDSEANSLLVGVPAKNIRKKRS